MTPDEIRRIAREGAREGVREALLCFGVDISDHRSLGSLQADLHFLHRQRRGSEELTRRVKLTLIAACVSGGLLAFWHGLKFYLKRGTE